MKRLRLSCVIVIALCVAAIFANELGASAPHTITITGTGAVVQLSTTDQQASSLQFTAPAANSGNARIGDSTTSVSVGELLPPGSGQYFAPRANGAYSLNTWYAYVASGDKLTIVWVDQL